MSDLAFDLGASLRYLRQRPLLALLSIGTLGVGLGVASALFAVIDALYIRPLPLDARKEIVVVRGVQGGEDSAVSRDDMNDLLNAGAVEAFGGMRDWHFVLAADGTPEPVEAVLATPGAFDAFSVKPHLGRLFRSEESRGLLLTFAAWQRRFGGSPNILGRSLILNGDAFTVIGVLPENFVAPSFRDAELWAPLSYDPDSTRGRGFRNLTVVARLVRSHDLQAFQSELDYRAQTLEREHPSTNRGWSVRAIPLIDFELGPVMRQLMILGIAVTLLLTMAVATLATVIFSDSMNRRSEYGIRAAMGGSTLRLCRQLLFDNLLLCLIGAIAAVAIAFVLLLATAPLAAAGIPRFDEIAPSARILLFALAVAVATAALFAIASVLWSGRGEPAEHIRASASASIAGARWGSSWLVALQVMLAFVLLALALRFGWSYSVRAGAERGFDPDSLLFVRVKAADGMNRAELVQAATDATTALATVPGAASAAIASSGPMFGGREELEVAADAVAPHGMRRFANVDSGFFSTMRIPIVAGREFTPNDRGRRAVVIISRGLAARHFPYGEAIGKSLWLGAPKRVPHEIIGIAGDVEDIRADRGGPVDVYLPFAQDPRGMFFFVVRGALPARLPALPRFMVLSTKSMQAALDAHFLVPKVQMALLALFAVGAMLLAVIAVYGMVTLVVGTRREEIRLRLALGAAPRDAQLLLLRAILAPVVSGLLAGWLLLELARGRVQPLVEPAAMSWRLVAVTAAFVLTLAIAASLRSVRETARVVV